MRNLLAATFAMVSFGLAGVAEAQNMSVMMDLRKNCMEDAKKACPKEMSKPSLLMQCLVDNQSKLSPNCQAATGRMSKNLGLKPRTANQ